MKKPDWASIKSDYVETTLTLADVQDKWGIPRGTLSARSTREKWHEEKQLFAAKLEQSRRETVIAKRAAEQEHFEDIVLKVAKGQLAAIAREMKDTKSDAAVVLKLANALETLQRIGKTAYQA